MKSATVSRIFVLFPVLVWDLIMKKVLFSAFNFRIICGVECAGNQIIRESAGQKPPIQSETRCVHSRSSARLCLATILSSPLQGRFSPHWHYAQKPHAETLDKWVEPKICSKEVNVLLISQESILRAGRLMNPKSPSPP